MKRIILYFLAIACILISVPPIAAESLPIFATIDQPHFFDVPPAESQSGEWIYTQRELGTITEIVIHHSGSFPYGQYDDADMVAGYIRYHQGIHCGTYDNPSSWNLTTGLPAQEGFPDGYSGPAGWDLNSCDYHWLVGTDGVIYQGRPEDTVGWHSSNWECNLRSIGICFVGLFDSQEPNAIQYAAGVRLVADLAVKYHISIFSKHSDYAAKSCPGYVFPWYDFTRDGQTEAGLYPDCTYTDWFHPSVMKLSRAKLITGLPDGKIYPRAMITRAEFCTILWRANGSLPVGVNYFSDTTAHWAKNAINWCRAHDLVSGYPNGLFYPDLQITRAEMAKIVALWKNLSPSNSIFNDCQTNWANIYIGACQKSGYLNGYEDNTFKPNNFSARAEAFTLVSKSMP